jgi:hypothetical protein
VSASYNNIIYIIVPTIVHKNLLVIVVLYYRNIMSRIVINVIVHAHLCHVLEHSMPHAVVTPQACARGKANELCHSSSSELKNHHISRSRYLSDS